jgi:hypothetical protein
LPKVACSTLGVGRTFALCCKGRILCRRKGFSQAAQMQLGFLLILVRLFWSKTVYLGLGRTVCICDCRVLTISELRRRSCLRDTSGSLHRVSLVSLESFVSRPSLFVFARLQFVVTQHLARLPTSIFSFPLIWLVLLHYTHPFHSKTPFPRWHLFRPFVVHPALAPKMALSNVPSVESPSTAARRARRITGSSTRSTALLTSPCLRAHSSF